MLQRYVFFPKNTNKRTFLTGAISIYLIICIFADKKHMNKIILIFASLFVAINATAQDSIFKGKIVNDEYNVYIYMNFYNQDIIVPGQSVYGKLSGYIGTTKSNYVWLITSAKIKDRNTALLSIINDYGSEDLTCTLSLNTDNTFTLKQDNGATLKIVADRKYVKIPKSIIFKRK